jgi:glutamate synthase (NADPH/NADH) small chain
VGHSVTVFERDERPGGLLRFGIPEFKMEKQHVDRRIAQMEAEGTTIRCGVNVGVDISADQLREDFDAVILAGGATVRRGLPIEGHDASGIVQAMDFLPLANRVQSGDLDESSISAAGLDVVIIGGGDTGADCLGTSNRQGARSVHQFEIMPQPPDRRADAHPWPTWPFTHKVTSAHEEGGERVFAVNTVEFVKDDAGHVQSLKTVQVQQTFTDGRMSFDPVAGTERDFPAQLVLLAMGFTGPQQDGLLSDLGVDFTDRGNVARADDWATNVDDVWVCGDMGRGQSLIVWAIAEGRSCAASVDRALMGSTLLPTSIAPTAAPLS